MGAAMKIIPSLSVLVLFFILVIAVPLSGQNADTTAIRLPSILQVNSEPKNAMVFIDGAYSGVTPFQEEIKPGNHRIVMKKELFYDDSVDMYIPEGTTKSKQFDLKANYGIADIRTTPEQGAEVFINDVFVGITPFVSQRMPSGRHSLRVVKRMYKTVTGQIVLWKGMTSTQTIALPVNFGTLHVRSPKSNIYINGELTGKDDYTTILEAGKYLIRAERSFQYSPVEQEANIVVNSSLTFELNPKPRYGSISVIVEPYGANDAEVIVNDEQKGKAPLVLQSLIGSYVIQVNKDKYLNVRQEISVRENENTKVKFELVTVEESRRNSINSWNRSKWISTAIGLLAAGTSVYFNYQANAQYHSYSSATTTERALFFREKTKTSNVYFSVSLAVFGTSAITSMYSWFKETSF
jgi:hypothetical protein